MPIRRYQQQIIDSVRANPVTVVIGETGSGKTTQISQILEEAGFAAEGIIGVTQPRRVVRETFRDTLSVCTWIVIIQKREHALPCQQLPPADAAAAAACRSVLLLCPFGLARAR